MRDSMIVGPNKHRVAVLVPAYPEGCSYFRVVRFNEDASKIREIMFWNCEEWGAEDTDLSCIGAIAAVIKMVNDGNDFKSDTKHEDCCEWEDVED